MNGLQGAIDTLSGGIDTLGSILSVDDPELDTSQKRRNELKRLAGLIGGLSIGDIEGLGDLLNADIPQSRIPTLVGSLDEINVEILSHRITVSAGDDLNAAILQASQAGGCGVVFVADDFTQSETIVPQSRVRIVGQGRKKNTIKYSDSMDLAERLIDPSDDCVDFGFEDIQIDFNNRATVYGLYMGAGVKRGRFRSVGFMNLRNENSNATGLSFRSADNDGFVLKDVWFDHINTPLAAPYGFIDFEIDEFEITNWANYGIYAPGILGKSLDFKIKSGRIRAPKIETLKATRDVEVTSTGIRQPIAFQGDNSDGYGGTKHKNGLVQDVHIEAPDLQWYTDAIEAPTTPGNRVNNGASADQFSFHHTNKLREIGCTAFGSGDVGFTVAQFCSDVELLLCEANNCQTVGAAIGVTGAGTRRVTVNGGNFNNNGLDARDEHPNSRGGIKVDDSEEFRAVGGVSVLDTREGNGRALYGIELKNSTDYYLCPSIRYGGAVDDVKYVGTNTEYNTGR